MRSEGDRVRVYCTGHKHSRNVCEAFAEGADGVITRNAKRLYMAPAAFYGWRRGNEPLIAEAKAKNVPWYYIDNGYIRAGHYDGYYRVTRGAYQISTVEKGSLSRFRALGVEIEPWKPCGEYILVCPPGDLIAGYLGINVRDWIRKVRRMVDGRKMLLRTKGCHRPLADDLSNTHVLVTAFSNAAVEALLGGIGVFCTHPCASTPLSLKSITGPNRGPNGDRLAWASSLAANQWTLDEMRRGVCWTDIVEAGNGPR